MPAVGSELGQTTRAEAAQPPRGLPQSPSTACSWWLCYLGSALDFSVSPHKPPSSWIALSFSHILPSPFFIPPLSLGRLMELVYN